MDDETIYFIYHIPGKKIGVTRDLISRVVDQQGYALDEVEVLDQSTNIDYISDREIELQQSYGYRVDRQKYKDLYINLKKIPMKINATEQTSTFPVPLNKLKGRLMDELGRSWETIHGTFELTKDTVKWIVDNAKTSMYNDNRTYIYNKAFSKEFLEEVDRISNKAKEEYNEYISMLAARAKLPTNGKTVHSKTEFHTENRFDLIRTWADERGLYDKGDTKTQFCKLMEEAGELGRAVLKNYQTEFVDAIGDMVVVLTNLAHLGGTSIEQCIDQAYHEIKSRKGKMVNGTFVKNG